jgi:hypothetical protein
MSVVMVMVVDSSQEAEKPNDLLPLMLPKRM